jgi:signal-transduction protein with cAMP-binding, CBS, and nucleotidyltransferase domain
LAENENYNVLSENIKVKIVKENLMLDFQERFDILFIDPEFNFKADKRLITKVIASLSYEHFEPEESILRLDVVSSEIYFIYEGEVEVTYKDRDNVLIYFDQGSYIGDTSYIFKIRNQYKYRCIADGKSKPRIYALHDKYLFEIFNDYPAFKNVLQIRALRRHHYLRKLKNQHLHLY